MKYVRNLIVLFLLAMFPALLHAAAVESSVVQCSASEAACNVWRKFRKAHPFPYQTTAVSATPNGETVVIISEPPPVATPEDIAAIAVEVFEDYSPQVYRLRHPIGLDGWLEDIVIQFNAGSDSVAPVATADSESMEIGSGVANRLEYLHNMLFGVADAFYVDVIKDGAVPHVKALADLKVTGADILDVIGDRNRKWRRLDGSESASLTWSEAEQNTTTKVRSFIDDTNLVVALFIPPDTEVDAIRGEFRRFAVASDYIVGALCPKRKGLVLLGRNRVIPLDVLPPLRFETVAALAVNLGEPLGQSYERQRVFAGKVLKGDYAGWDWAPIYLSPQLQDTEFGTLLNLADQQLKSWSERGDIRYATFDYPDPAGFPFGDRTAMSWFGERTIVPALIFNWNTTAFSTALPHARGRVLSAASTTALPVSYIIPRDPLLDELLAMISTSRTDHAGVVLEGSNMGTDYFMKLGDPILARVVQNVFVYQILSEAKPFRKATSTATVRETKRSKGVTRILVDEVNRWLTDVTDTRNPQDAEVAALVRKSGLPIAKLAELLATPDVNTKAIIKTQAAFDLHRRRLESLLSESESKEAEVRVLGKKATQEFDAHCASLGGTIEETDRGRICRYRAQREVPFESQYDARLAVLGQEFEKTLADVKETVAAAEAARLGLQKLISDGEIADELAKHLSARFEFSQELERVLARVLEATSTASSTSAIQTASVVLSRNTTDIFAIGGHNIDGLPWLVKEGATSSKPMITASADRPTIVLGKEQAGRSTLSARAAVQQKVDTPPPPRSLADALAANPARKGSFLDEVLKKPLPPRDPNAVLANAKSCDCDLYIERGPAETSTIVSLKPPPKIERVFGTSRLIERLAADRSAERVIFVGFPEQQVAAFSKNAVRKANAARPERGSIGALFQRAADPAKRVLRLQSKHGKPAFVTFARQELAASLSKQAPWADAEVTAGRGLSLVEIRFPRDKSQIESVTVFAYDGNRKALTTTDLRDAAAATVRAVPNDAFLRQAIEKLMTRLHQENDVQQVEFFLDGLADSRFTRLLPASSECEQEAAIAD